MKKCEKNRGLNFNPGLELHIALRFCILIDEN